MSNDRRENWFDYCPYCDSKDLVKDHIEVVEPPMTVVVCCSCKQIDRREIEWNDHRNISKENRDRIRKEYYA